MSQAVIPLPSRFNVSTLYPFVASLIGLHKQPLHQRVLFDFWHLRFIEGDGLTVFSNTIEWLMKRGVDCQFTDHLSNSPALLYLDLDDCGFFSPTNTA